MILTEWKYLGDYDTFVGEVVTKFMTENDVKNLKPGRYEIGNDCFILVSDYENFKNNKFEGHRRYVDVQLMVVGEENIHLTPIGEGRVVEPYDTNKDMAIYACDGYYKSEKLKQNYAMILMPNDLHAPSNGEGGRINKKIIFKIPVNKVTLK